MNKKTERILGIACLLVAGYLYYEWAKPASASFSGSESKCKCGGN